MGRIGAFCKKWDMLPGGSLILCAVSGGRDSMALLHWLRAVSERGGFRVAAAHFNHQLRPTAGRDEQFVRDWCRMQDIPLTCGRGDVRSFAREAGTSLEDAARTLRYRFLEETAGQLGADRIATAHHQEDNAETVLLHLLRGCALQGLCGIRPMRGQIVRPLLETSRQEINAYVAFNHIPYMEDETNRDTAYARNRLRLEIMPLLEEVFPGCAGRIAGTGALLREEEEYLRQETERSAPAGRGNGSITLDNVWSGNAVIGRRLIRYAAHHFGVELDRRSTENIWELPSGGYLDLPGGLCAFRTGEKLTVQKPPEPPRPMALRPGEQSWGPWRVHLTQERAPAEETPHSICIYLKRDIGTLTIAPWDGKGRLAVENGSRTIKRLFVDKNIPIERRREHPALYLDGKPAAVFGVAVDRSYRPREGEPCWTVTLLPEETMCL